MEYLTTQQMSKLWNISDRRIRLLCKEGRVLGVKKEGKQWLIPSNAKRLNPKNARQKNTISIVTIGPMGPGIEICKYLLHLGYDVCVIARDEKIEKLVLSSIEKNLLKKVMLFNGCLYDENFLEQLYQHIKDYTIEQIYFCELLAIFTPAEENSYENIKMVLEYHLKGFILACAKFYSLMNKTKLIFLIPKRAALQGIANQTLWSCVWSGIVGFTESLRAACSVGENFEVINVYHGAILSEFWKMDALGMPVEIPVNFINPTDLAQLVVDTVLRKTSARVSELHFERLGVWKK